MNFFDQQDQAKKKTGRLIALLALGVLSIILFVQLPVFWMIAFDPKAGGWPAVAHYFVSPQFWITNALIGLVIAGGYAYTLSKMSAGGEAIALMSGARPVSTDSDDPKVRQLQNILEEMSLASGVPCPPLYVSEDMSINAFVAGTKPSNAIMAVTRGSLEALTRDEMQGVVGHEFSHILNNDMAMNMRIFATIGGLTALTTVGRYLIHVRGSGKNGNNAALVGLLMIVLGLLGVLFGRLIQAAVSRQREYLADASAVQFTRNPDGIANALWRIGKTSSALEAADGADISHFCFSDAVAKRGFNGLATHPPIKDRIRAIKPDFEPPQNDPDFNASKPLRMTTPVARGVDGVSLVMGISSVAGRVPIEASENASNIVRSLSPGLHSMLHRPLEVEYLLYACIISDMDSSLKSQAMAFCLDHSSATKRGLGMALDEIKASPLDHLGLAQLASATLRQAPTAELERIFSNTCELILMDDEITYKEMAFLLGLSCIIPHSDIDLALSGPNQAQAILLNVVAQASSGPQEALNAGLEALGEPQARLVEVEFNQALAAMDLLNLNAPAYKRDLLDAAIAAVREDGRVEPDESMIVRGLAMGLDIPVSGFL